MYVFSIYPQATEYFLLNVILFSKDIAYKCNILLWKLSNTMNI